MLEILFTEPLIFVRADTLCIVCLGDIPDIIVCLYRVLNHLHGWQYTLISTTGLLSECDYRYLNSVFTPTPTDSIGFSLTWGLPGLGE